MLAVIPTLGIALYKNSHRQGSLPDASQAVTPAPFLINAVPGGATPRTRNTVTTSQESDIPYHVVTMPLGCSTQPEQEISSPASLDMGTQAQVISERPRVYLPSIMQLPYMVYFIDSLK